VSIFASNYNCFFLLEGTLNLASLYVDCFYKNRFILIELQNVDVVLFIVNKQVLVIKGCEQVLGRILRSLHRADLFVFYNFSVIGYYVKGVLQHCFVVGNARLFLGE